MSDVQAAVREKPILFSSEMVRAILDRRKSMTRRIVKVPVATVVGRDTNSELSNDVPRPMPDWQREALIEKCPYGAAGTRLWVRERVALNMPVDQFQNGVAYWATDSSRCASMIRWRPSIHMPRWASRLTLEITEVRVERVQDISAREIIEEGVQYPVSADRSPMVRLTGKCPPVKYHRRINITKGETLTHEELLRCHFASLWDEINGEGSWESNPWVWVISFNRLEAQ